MFKVLKALVLGGPRQKSKPVQRQPHTSRGVDNTDGKGILPPNHTNSDPETSSDSLKRPSRRGQASDYEPAKLRDFHAPISINAKGIAGLGLFQSGFNDRNVYNGQQGEVGFYKALCLANQVDRATSYWSVAMPADGTKAAADTRFNTDVDCIVVQGSSMYLIDLKYYASGDVTWHSADGQRLLCRDNPTGKQVGEPRKMSRNMAMAQSRFPKIFPNHRVSSFVVLIPTNNGLGRVDPGTEWPGGVPLITLPDMLQIIGSGSAGYADSATDAALTALLKD